MADVKWTPQQQAAIEDSGGALLVSAAAGSGKTAVLVERAVRMITREESPVPADRLLVLTFTNAAAEELRTRIAARVEQEIRARVQDTVLRRQRMLLRRAFIGTIDAFCQQLVKENFARLDLPPDIAVGEESLLAQLSAGALADVMEEMYADEDFAAFAGLYGQSRSDRPAEEAILALHGFTTTLPGPMGQLRRWAAMYEEEAPLEQTEWGKELMAYGAEAARAMEQILRQAVDIAAGENDAEFARTHKTIFYSTQDGMLEWEIISVGEVDATQNS
jgi:ATP-dependent helicase/nuclease subunit A